MLELAALIAAAAIATTFFLDAGADTMKLARSMRRRGAIRVAEKH